MVNQGGSKRMWLRPNLVERLHQRWTQEPDSTTGTPNKFGTFVNDIIERVPDKYEYVQKHHTDMQYLGLMDSVMLIRDSKKNKVAEITLKNDKPYCRLCQVAYCEHIIFAGSIPEIAQLDKDISKRFRPRRMDVVKMLIGGLVPIAAIAILSVTEDCLVCLS
jgi:hypothetical protein